MALKEMRRPGGRCCRRKILYIILCTITFIVVFTVSMGHNFRKAVHKANKAIIIDSNDKEEIIHRDIKYNSGENCGYDLYIPQKHSDARNYSLVLFIHGGSFTGGDKEEGVHWCRYYASKGRVAASVNYTLHSTEKPSNINIMLLLPILLGLTLHIDGLQFVQNHQIFV